MNHAFMPQKGFSNILAGVAGYFVLIKKQEPVAQEAPPSAAVTPAGEFAICCPQNTI